MSSDVNKMMKKKHFVFIEKKNINPSNVNHVLFFDIIQLATHVDHLVKTQIYKD